jgi:hypothetical protein
VKVIQGGFKPPEGPEHAGERLRLQIEDSGVLEEKEGTFTILFDTGKSMYIMSNAEGPGDVLLCMEKGRMAVMANVYSGGPNDTKQSS